MSTELKGVKIAVLGGDARELVLVRALLSLDARVVAAGFSNRPELADIPIASGLEEALAFEPQVVMLPMSGTDAQGKIRAPYAAESLILTPALLRQLPPGTLMLIGVARDFLKQWARDFGLSLVEMADIDELAIYNSIPSAEGAIQLAMENTPFTIHASKSAVLGFGRVGVTLARALAALGSRVTVVARNPRDLARAFEQGYQTGTYNDLESVLKSARLIFNTVPALVLPGVMLEHCSPEAVIIDLATDPGGTDFQAAAALGIKAILAPGIPGKVAPETAGQFLARVVPRLIKEHLSPRQ